jgi:hypothetical protein
MLSRARKHVGSKPLFFASSRNLLEAFPFEATASAKRHSDISLSAPHPSDDLAARLVWPFTLGKAALLRGFLQKQPD